MSAVTSTPFARALTVLRETRTGVDEYGKDVLTSTPVAVPGCSWWPLGSTETRSDGDTVVSRHGCLFPVGSSVHALDRVELPDYPGEVWSVEGEPRAHYSSITGAAGQLYAELVKVTG